MCDPIIIGTIVSVGTTVATMARQSSIARKNEQAANDWAAYQLSQRRLESERQDELNQQANQARIDSLYEMAPQAQMEAQTEEQARLEEYLGPQEQDINVTVADNMLSGQQRGSTIFGDALKDKLRGARAQAQKRIAALAKLQSYGGSMNGLEQRNQRVALEGGNRIDLANNKRSGSLSAYGAAKAVNPVQYFG